MKLNELKNKKKIITAEIFPPKGADIKNVLNKAQMLKEKVDAFNITDNQRATMRISALALSAKLKEKGFEPIYQLTCRDRNRLALQSDLLGASLLGIENVLLLSGDHPKNGDHPDAKPVFDFDSVSLLQAASNLNNGLDFKGNKLNSPTNLYLGAVVNPTATDIDMQLSMMIKKIKAGARFFQTQIIFYESRYLKFLNKLKGEFFSVLKEEEKDILILPGVLLIHSERMLQNLIKLPGINIPQETIDRLQNSSDFLKEGILICAELITKLLKFADGVHIMAINKEEAIPEILSKVKF